MEELSKALTRHGVSVTVITSHCHSPVIREVSKEGIEILRAGKVTTGVLGSNLIDFSQSAARLYYGVLRKADVIHAFPGFLFSHNILKLRSGAVIKHFFHVPIPRYLPALDLLQEPVMRVLWNVYLRGADFITVEHIPETYEWAVLRHTYHLRESSMRFAPAEGVDAVKFNPRARDDALSEQLGTHSILCVGPFYEAKGYGDFAKVVPLVLQEVRDARFVFVGEGPYKENLMASLESEIAGGRAIFTGFISDELLPRYYSSVSVYAFPSYREGMPLLPLEAMACGTPVVSSNLPITEYEIDECGLLVRPGDPGAMADGLVRLLQDEKLRRRLGREGVGRVQSNFTWDKAAERIMAIYDEAIDHRVSAK